MKQEMLGWQWHQMDHNANHLHLTPDRKSCPHLITQFLQDVFSSWCTLPNQ